MVKAGQQSARRLASAAVRRELALDLYVDGATFQQVADALDYCDRSSSRRAIMTALEETATRTVGLAEQARPIIAARLERLYAKWADRADEDPKAAALVIQMFDRFCKIYGLDAPVKVEATVVTRTQLDADIEQLLGKVRELPPPQTPAPPTETERTP